MESSSHGENKTLDQIISELCKVDVLVLPNFMKDCQNILKEVRIPKAGWREETSYQLHEENSTYRYRLGVFETFVNTKAKITINDNKSEKEFCKTFSEFLYEKENHCSNDELNLSKVPSDDSKVEGIVIRKSADRVCLYITAPRVQGPPEQVLSYKAEEFPGLGLTLKVGDVLCVNYRKKVEVFDKEVIRYLC